MSFDLMTKYIYEHWNEIIIIISLWSLIAYPLIGHVTCGLSKKESDICESLSTKSKRTYLKFFQRQIKVDDSSSDEACEKAFVNHYRKWYGRRQYIFPIILSLIIAAIDSCIVGSQISKSILEQPWELKVAPSAVAGAYLFVACDLLTRSHSKNMSVADIMRNTLRLGIAIPLGYAFASLCKDNGVFLAFAIGILPINTITIAVRQISNKKLGTEIGAGDQQSQVIKLSGVDTSIAERLQDADITTIAQLAWCDPIQLSMRTNLDFPYIMDACGQALAWVYLDDKLDKLRSIGLRSAIEIYYLTDDLTDDDAKASAVGILNLASEITQINNEGMLNTFKQIAADPYVEFLWNAWCDHPGLGGKRYNSISLGSPQKTEK